MKIRMAVPVTVEEVHEIDSLPDNWDKMAEWQRDEWVAHNGEFLEVSDPQYNGGNIKITSIEEQE